MPLNNEQRRAVEYLDGPLLVLAGPGTGKTQLLSAKVAYILENTDASAENILCLTFTEAGAENMRNRLRSMVGRVAENVNIYTYHAFGKNLLDRYRNYAETVDRKLDNAIDDTMQYRIISEIQQKLPATDILRTAQTKNIIEVISNAKSARLTPEDLQKIADRNLEDSRDLSEEISPILESARKGARATEAIENTWRPVLAVLAAHISTKPIVKNIEPLANPLAIELENAIKKAEELNSASPLTKWKTNNFEKDDAGNFRLKNHIANKKLLSVSKIMLAYNSKLAEAGLFDFDDMIEETINYLKTDDGFRLSLSELFQYILLDEFQDTNPSQFELIKLLTDYEQPVIMAVGDDDQAIYEFQGANASNLMDFQEHYDSAHITLVDNYRSTGEILNFSRHIADQIADSFSKKSEHVNKNLHSVKDEGQKSPRASQISRHEFPCAEAEYNFVAEKIRELVDSGEDPNEIAILAPKHKNLIAILPYLKNQGLNIAYEKRDNLLKNEIVQQIIELSRFCFALGNGKQPSHQLLAILSYDFWGIPALDAVSLFTKRHEPKPTLEILSSNTKFSDLANFFGKLALKTLTSPFELWLNYLLGVKELDGFKSPFLDYYKKSLSEAELLELYENLATLRQATLAHTSAIQLGPTETVLKVSDFIMAIDDYENAESEIMRISNYRDSEHAVQVMTAFKSKGLEFKHVFLTAVDNRAWGMAKGNNNMLVLPKNLTKIRHTGNTDDEKLRVLFVALTRAKESLYLTSSHSDSAGKTNDRLSYLNESSFDEPDAISPFLPETAQKITIHEAFDTSKKIDTLALSWLSHYVKYTPELLPVLKTRVENYRLSATDLTSFVDIIYSGPQDFYRRRILQEPDAPATIEQVYGTLIHAVFEQVTNQGLDDAAALELFRSLVARATLEPEEVERLAELGETNLKIALDNFADILQHPHAKAEINLSPEHPSYDGIPLVGKLDHINIDHEAKTIEIYDFKTGKYHPERWSGSNPALYRYRLQLGLYKLLLNLSPTYSRYKVTTGHILFVTPDAEGKVYDKPYDYNPKDEEELKMLIKAVYHQISSLDFLTNPDLFVPADKSNTMTNIRAFIDKLVEDSFSSPYWTIN